MAGPGRRGGRPGGARRRRGLNQVLVLFRRGQISSGRGSAHCTARTPRRAKWKTRKGRWPSSLWLLLSQRRNFLWPWFRSRQRCLSALRYQLEFREPRGRFRITWCSPVTARRQRATRTDFGRIRNGAAFELTELEEPIHKRSKMPLDVANRVLVTVLRRNIRPNAFVAAVPRAIREKRHARR